MQLEFGYRNIPDDAKAVLGIRAIYNGNSIDIVPDRVSWIGSDEHRNELRALLTDEQWDYLTDLAKKRTFGQVNSDKVTSYERDGLNVIGSPQASCGYLYLSFWV